MTSFIKHLAIQALLPTLRAYMRFFPSSLGKSFVYKQVIEPYFRWRTFECISTTKTGLLMRTCLPDLIQSRIYFFGEWEPQITAFIEKRLSKGDTFIDVGANIGYYSLLAASLVGDIGKVLAIEASPRIFKSLQNNIQLNNFKNIELFNKAASDKSGVLEIFLAPESNMGATTTVISAEARSRNSRKAEATVSAQTLDEIVHKDRLLQARLIKIDIEGAEASVIKGIQTLLPLFSDQTEWVFEVNPEAIKLDGYDVEQLINDFRTAGYKLYRIPNDYTDSDYLSNHSGYNLSELTETPLVQIDVIASRIL